MRTQLLMLVVILGTLSCATNLRAGTSAEPPPAGKESQRAADLYRQVSRFLDEVAALEPPLIASKLEFPTRGWVPGWSDRVCPQLTGLSKQEGELILTRVLEIARAAGVRVANEHCSPNFDIFVTDQPRKLLQGLRKQNSFAMFGPRGSPYLLDQFIATPRPVRVWYNIYEFGQPPVLAFGYTFTRVLVIVDEAKLQGVSRNQLADYIAMVGLVEIKPDGHLGDTPTILGLFDGTPQAGPKALSDWDEAFLKSLYSGQGPWRRELGKPDRLTLTMGTHIAR